MRIVIPSMGRAQRQFTLRELPSSLLDRVTLVVHPDEADEYRRAFPDIRVDAQPVGVEGIAQVREWVLFDSPDPHVIFCDDDLRFSVRPDGVTDRLVPATPEDVHGAFATLDASLDSYAHCSISERNGNNRVDAEYAHNTRLLRVLAYNADMIRSAGCSFIIPGDHEHHQMMEDYHMSLSLLRAGYQNVVYYAWAQDQQGSDLLGGCSVYRTGPAQAESARRLKAAHPDFVTLVEKTTEGGWRSVGATRLDVKIAWKKAYASSGAA